MKLSHTCHQSDAKRWHVGWVTGQIVAPAAKKIRERVMTSFSENFMKDFSLVYKQLFTANNPENSTKKSYTQWTSKDIENLSSDNLSLIRKVFAAENYSYTDGLLPDNMSRAEFYRSLLRASAKRGDLRKDYYGSEPETSPMNQKITVARESFGQKATQKSTVTEEAGIIALRDKSIDIVLGNYPASIKNDVKQKLNKSKEPIGLMGLETDVDVYGFGYLVGSLPQFKRDDGLNIRLTVERTPEEIQRDYCPVIDKIFQPGNAYNNRDTLVLGFMQARIDGRNNFEAKSDRIGLFAECPSTPKVNRNQASKQK
jgi:hypothetical protein